MKKVVVTGGNKGIGLAVSRKFIEAEYEVFIVARNFASSELKETSTVHFVPFDLINIDRIPDLVLQIGGIDVLVNNAGMMNALSFDRYPEEKKDQILKLNIEAPVALITHFSKAMVQNKSGRIVNTASIAGEIGHPDVWYGITKAGIINATKSFAKILGSHGITVNCALLPVR
jgi:NAD(P)-dependent dehydrogenase (short-subunit alcohol dehydrogenase family)